MIKTRFKDENRLKELEYRSRGELEKISRCFRPHFVLRKLPKSHELTYSPGEAMIKQINVELLTPTYHHKQFSFDMFAYLVFTSVSALLAKARGLLSFRFAAPRPLGALEVGFNLEFGVWILERMEPCSFPDLGRPTVLVGLLELTFVLVLRFCLKLVLFHFGYRKRREI